MIRNDSDKLPALQDLLQQLHATLTRLPAPAALPLLQDVLATQFHACYANHVRAVVVLGGTGTGKSTLVNRLLESPVSAASFRRTFTAGPVAIAANANQLVKQWMNLPTEPAAPPARGQNDRIMLVQFDSPLTRAGALVDTPDLDGDVAEHHSLADRAFRWATAVVFLVSPEKYQMTELPPYYRLAERYGIPSFFVMNKCETSAQLEDYRRLLPADASLFAIARDDAGWQPPSGADLPALRQALLDLQTAPSLAGLAFRCHDLAERLMDRVIGPMQQSRRRADSAMAGLKAMQTLSPQLDVSPVTEQLQKRMRERSFLYLIGPQRMLDRVRQAPALLARLPRTAWDLVMRGKLPDSAATASSAVQGVPDFRSIAVDQFQILRSRIDDTLRTSGVDPTILDSSEFAKQLIPPDDAGKIVDEEMAELSKWLEARWHATPRDTAMLEKLLKLLPGGKQITKLSEAAPYLLTVVLVTHHAFFGHIDLLILGGWSLATWLTEKVSNEVAAKARATNDRIAQRFQDLSRQQVRQINAHLQNHTPAPDVLDQLTRLAERLHSIQLP